MKKIPNSTAMICEVGIFAAIGYVLDELQGILSKGLFINGGSIGFAMIAVLIIAFRRGWLPAILTGLIMGALDLATSAYILHPAQLLLDYVFPYAFVGFVGFLKPFFDKAETKQMKAVWLVIGTIIGGMLKFVSHFLAGILFWADPENFAWNLNSMNPYLYCFIYNIAFIGPSIILTSGILSVVCINAPQIITIHAVKPVKDPVPGVTKLDIYSLVESIIYLGGGTFTFIYFLIKYILSFGDYHDGAAYGYDFDPDCMIIFILGFMFFVMGINTLFATIKKKHNITISFIVSVPLLSASLVYATSRLIRMYRKEKDPTTYWIWLGIGLATLLIAIVFYIYKRMKLKKMGD